MYIQRSNQTVIYQSLARPFVTALLGSRRVGKSTLVKEYAIQYITDPTVFLNMDIREERLRVENSQLKSMIEERTQQQIGKGKKIWVIIDEAQKCPLLFDQVKILYDQFKDKDTIKFILTGSGFLSLHQLSAESLAGRIELYYLREFGLKETTLLNTNKSLPNESILDIAYQGNIQQLEKAIHSISPFRPLNETSLQEQLIWGGLPEVLQESDSSVRMTYLGNYLQTYLEKDIRAITTITDINLYQKLMEVIAEQTGSVRQDKKIIEALDCSRDTLKKYRGFLLATLVYQEIYPFINSSLKRIVKSPKGYLLNNGLISYLTNIDNLNILEKSGLVGHRFENWFLKELQIWLDRTIKRNKLYYWRTSGGTEIDFVVDIKPDIFPFEISYSKRIQDKKIKNLKSFLADYPKAKIAYYIYLGDFHYDPHAKICFLPAWVIS
jgi:uncharacterized protein